MKTKSCDTCRKQIHAEEQEAFLKKEYAVLKDAAYTFAVYATTAALAVQVRRGRSKEYIQALFDDMVELYSEKRSPQKRLSERPDERNDNHGKNNRRLVL